MIAQGHPWHVGAGFGSKRIGSNIRRMGKDHTGWQRLMNRLEADAYFEQRDDAGQCMSQELAAWALEDFSRFDPERNRLTHVDAIDYSGADMLVRFPRQSPAQH